MAKRKTSQPTTNTRRTSTRLAQKNDPNRQATPDKEPGRVELPTNSRARKKTIKSHKTIASPLNQQPSQQSQPKRDDPPTQRDNREQTDSNQQTVQNTQQIESMAKLVGNLDQSDTQDQFISNGSVEINSLNSQTNSRPDDNHQTDPNVEPEHNNNHVITNQVALDQQIQNIHEPLDHINPEPFSPSPSPIPQRRVKRPAPQPSSPSPLPTTTTSSHKRANFSPESSASPIPVRRSLARRPTPQATGPSKSVSRPASPPTSDLHPLQSPSKRSRQSPRLPSTTPNFPHLSTETEIGTTTSTSQIDQSKPLSELKPPVKPTRRPQRPIKKVSTQTTHDPNPEDDFFNLSNRKQIHFVSKTLGLTKASPAPSNLSTSKSPTRASVDPPQRNLNLVDLSGDENSNEHDDDSDSMSEEDRKTKRNHSSRALPNWTKASQIRPHDSSSDEETGGSVNVDPNGKRSQHRSGQKQVNASVPEPVKSRSPTPPPQQDETEIRKAMKSLYKTLTHQDHVSSVQKQTLEAVRRLEEAKLIQALSGLDDPRVPATYTTVIARDRNRPRGSNQAPNPSLGAMITLTINMVMDPRVAASTTQQVKDHYERPTHFNMQSGERFDVIYQRFHELTGLAPNQLVVSHDHIKLSPFVTPESVRIYGNTALKVYESSAWEYVSFLRRQRAHQPSQSNEAALLREELKNLPLLSQDEQSLIETTAGTCETKDVEVAEPESVGAGLLNLTVRTKDKTRVELSVKPTTTIRSIIKNTLIELNHPLHSQPPDPKSIKLHFDGQDLPFSSTVADHDLDDDDVLDLSFV